jgi:uncharacterized membrane protein YfcA
VHLNDKALSLLLMRWSNQVTLDSTIVVLPLFGIIFLISILLLLLVAMFIGMSKTGVHGAGMLAVPLLANIFGGQLSSGVMLPMLVLADILGVWYYHRHASWHHLKILFPWSALGVVLGTVVGSYIDDKVFKIIMAIIILVSVVVMLWLERGHKEEVPHNKAFGATTGVLGGFTSMVGNLAGTVMAVYLLSMRLPKNAFIGTTAWFFMATTGSRFPFMFCMAHNPKHVTPGYHDGTDDCIGRLSRDYYCKEAVRKGLSLVYYRNDPGGCILYVILAIQPRVFSLLK